MRSARVQIPDRLMAREQGPVTGVNIISPEAPGGHMLLVIMQLAFSIWWGL